MLFSKICAIFSATSPAHHGITVWNGGEVQCSSSHAPKLILSPPVCCQCALLIRSWHQNRRSEGMSRTVQLIHIFLTFMEQNIVLMIDIRQSHFRFHLFFIDISEDIPRCFFFYCLPMSISLTTLMKVKNSADGIYTYPMDPSIELYLHLNLHVSTGKYHLRLSAGWGHQSSQGHTFQGYWHDHTHLLTSLFVSCNASLPRNII